MKGGEILAHDAKRSFVLYYDYRDHLDLLKDEERGNLLMALLDYGEMGKKPELEGAALMAFSFIAKQMDRDAEKYAQTCAKYNPCQKDSSHPPPIYMYHGSSMMLLSF